LCHETAVLRGSALRIGDTSEGCRNSVVNQYRRDLNGDAHYYDFPEEMRTNYRLNLNTSFARSAAHPSRLVLADGQALNLAAARLRPYRWCSLVNQRYLNVELLKDQQMIDGQTLEPGPQAAQRRASGKNVKGRGIKVLMFWLTGNRRSRTGRRWEARSGCTRGETEQS
jgi:hypothetical protein